MPLKIMRFVRRVHRFALTGSRVLATCAVLLVLAPTFAHAVSIELKDEAPDRIERQRTAAMGRLPLPGTPDVSKFDQRLAAKGLKSGMPVFIRIFKSQSELEVWMEKDGTYQLFDTYPICHWSGTLGPKTYEGDKQTPEGFYTVTSRQLHHLGRWRQALNLGFPNALDQSLKRDGSYILVHGGCSSVGCFAMTNPVVEEIYKLTKAALKAGQRHVPVHVFPFRMKNTTLAKYKDSEWHPFWTDLKAGYDAFEKTKRPPQVTVCKGRYVVNENTTTAVQEVAAHGPLAVCGPTAAELLNSDKSAWLVPLPSKAQSPALTTSPLAVMPSAATPPAPAAALQAPAPPAVSQPASNQAAPQPTPQLTGPLLSPDRREVLQPSKLPVADAMTLAALRSPESTEAKPPEPGTVKGVETVDPALNYEFVPRLVAPQPKPGQILPPSQAGVGIRSRADVVRSRANSRAGTVERAGVTTRPAALPCSLSLPSCRRYAALLARQTSQQRAVARVQRRSGPLANR
jgi:murein L,D-transpeptidase YafK